MTLPPGYDPPSGSYLLVEAASAAVREEDAAALPLPRPSTSTADWSWRRRGARATSSAAWSPAGRALSAEISGACVRRGDPVACSDGRPGVRCARPSNGRPGRASAAARRARDRDVAVERVDPIVEDLLGDRLDGLMDARYGPGTRAAGRTRTAGVTWYAARSRCSCPSSTPALRSRGGWPRLKEKFGSALPRREGGRRCQATLETDPPATPKTDPRRKGVCPESGATTQSPVASRSTPCAPRARPARGHGLRPPRARRAATARVSRPRAAIVKPIHVCMFLLLLFWEVAKT